MSDNDAFYAELEATFITYRAMIAVPVADNGEPMVPIGADFPGRVLPPGRVNEADGAPDMADGLLLQRDYTGEWVYVRASVLERLMVADAAVQFMVPGGHLEVVFGYRHPAVQQAGYERTRAEVLRRQPGLEGEDLAEATHRFTAVPEVAGHPTGGAVDVRIVLEGGTPLPMGTEIGSFVKDTYTFSPFIGAQAWHNRQLLRAAMLRAGFAPFDGEWWHFCYGDREWAKYYNQPAALYGQLDFRA